MKRIINFFKKLFKKKEPEKIIPFKESETKLSQNQILIKNLEENRELIIKEQLRNKLKIKQEGSWIRIFFNKRIFLVDKEGLQTFNNEFNVPNYSLCLVHSRNGFYLARERKSTGKEEFFHRFLMKKEIEDFQLERGCSFEEVIVHHDNFKEWDNRKINLKVITKEEHDKIHKRKTKKY